MRMFVRFFKVVVVTETGFMNFIDIICNLHYIKYMQIVLLYIYTILFINIHTLYVAQ